MHMSKVGTVLCMYCGAVTLLGSLGQTPPHPNFSLNQSMFFTQPINVRYLHDILLYCERLGDSLWVWWIIFFCPILEKFCPLSSLRTFCSDGVLIAHMGQGFHFAHFQVQAQMALSDQVTVSLHMVKLLYTTIFQWDLKVATHYCVIVLQCFIPDQPDTMEISLIQLALAVTLHCGLLGSY